MHRITTSQNEVLFSSCKLTTFCGNIDGGAGVGKLINRSQPQRIIRAQGQILADDCHIRNRSELGPRNDLTSEFCGIRLIRAWHRGGLSHVWDVCTR